MEELQEKTNVNGGAIAIGHPVGASAARITMHLAYELEGGAAVMASLPSAAAWPRVKLLSSRWIA